MEKIELSNELFESIEWETATEEAPREECDSYSRIFVNRRKEAEENNDAEEYTLYDFLARITSFMLRPEGEHQVFTPQWSNGGSRSALPQDITEQELDLLEEFYPDAFENLELRARVGDLLWFQRRNHKAANIAIIAYIDSFAGLSNYAVNKLRRAVAITNMLGNAAQEERRQAIDKIKELIDRHKDDSDKVFWIRDLVDLLIENGSGDYEEYGNFTCEIAAREKGAGNWRKARALWEEAAKCYRRIPQHDKVSKCWEEVGFSFEKEAETESSAMLKADNIIKAIDAFRKVSGAEDKRGNLHSKLIRIQAKIPDELQSFSTEFDITHIVGDTETSFSGLELQQAIINLALIKPPISLEDLKSRIEENANSFPMQYIIGGNMINEMGKNVAKNPSLLTNDPEEYEDAIFAHSVKEAQQNRSISVNAMIEPARKKIIDEHPVSEEDLFCFIRHHPFIKNGHEDLIIKGMISGFYGDWITTAHVLCTQFEECLRYYFRINGIVTSRLDNKGIQEEKSLNQLFEIEFLKSTFGSDLVFELQSILTSSYGPNLRNKVAHGLMGYYDFFSPQIKYFWWLFLRITCLPTITAKQNPDESEEEDVDESNHEQEE